MSPISRFCKHPTRALALALAGLLFAAAAQAIERVQTWPRQRATPALELADAQGKVWRLSDFRGQVVVLNFWATWCEPCRAELPQLQQLAVQDPGQLTVLAVNYKEDAAKVQRFAQDTGLTLPLPLDRDGQAAGSWTPRIFPTTVVIDRNGRARWQVVGEFDWASDAARVLLDPLLNPALLPRKHNDPRMKKTFPLSIEGKNRDRVVEAVKNDIRKYLARERRKPLPEGVDFWDFDCQCGTAPDTATPVHVAALTEQINGIVAADSASLYVELLAKPGVRTAKPTPPQDVE